jgi:3-phenylpropionate/trans-cinnamate dioxygenase ferredoxin reductase subunit
MSQSFIVVGGGLAGAKTVQALRDFGYDGKLALICEENLLPYERPPLSKDYLAGTTSLDEFTVLTRDWYREEEVELQLGLRATSVHTGSHEVELADGSRLGYDKLVLATGSRPRRLSVPGTDAQSVHYLRRLGDADQIRAALGSASRLVVIGGGWIGLETAAVARQRGLQVTIVEATAQPLLGVLGPELARVFADLHRDHGVEFRLHAQVEEVTWSGVMLGDGTELPSDAVLIGIGARPDVELAERAGLDVDDGVLVDAGMTTSDPDVLAVGDIANALHPLLGTRVRVEHWANALSQPTTAAATMLGRKASHTELPFFFTDQYDLGMEYRGHVADPAEHRVVVRGELSSREFIAFWLDRNDRVAAGMNVNTWDVGDPIEALIRSGRPVSPERLSDRSVALDAVLT